MKPASSWKYVNQGLLVILGVFVLATIASIVFLSNTLLKLDSLIATSGQNVRTALVLQNLYIDLDDAESGARGYSLTGDPRFLEPYNTALKEIPSNLAVITSDQNLRLSKQQKQRLIELTQAKVDVLKEGVAAKTANDQETLATLNARREGSSLMNQIRAEVRTIYDQSLANIQSSGELSHAKLERALGVAAVLSVFVLSICVVLVWYFQRTILKERALESTKSEFLSLASHQLRTPATNVKQYIGLLLDGYLGKLTKEQKNALNVAYKNNESEIRIMNDLLDVAKLDLQRIQLRTQRVNIVSIVKQVVKESHPIAGSRGQSFDLKAPKELMAIVDRAYFKGVVEKLVDNALKYSREKTQISIRLKLDKKGDRFELVVKDHGVGIQRREITKLFMKFSRLANEFSANSEGSGLGLYWVKQIVALHGGTIQVSTRLGQGSTFTVRMPLA